GGQHANNGNRNLQHGSAATQRLRYRLFSNAGMTDEIGIDQDQPITITAANTNDVKLPVYGQVTLPGDSAAGTYTDTLLVTLTWQTGQCTEEEQLPCHGGYDCAPARCSSCLLPSPLQARPMPQGPSSFGLSTRSLKPINTLQLCGLKIAAPSLPCS